MARRGRFLLIKRFLLTLAIAASTALVVAQPDFDHRPSMFAGRTFLTLSLFEEVRTELKTTADLNAKIEAVHDKLDAARREAFESGNNDFEAIMPVIEKLNTKYDEEVVKLFSGDQVTRLKQLFVQYNGALAISNPTISKDLLITDEQKTKIKDVQTENGKKMRELFANGPPEDGQKAFEKLQDELKAALDKVLNDDQRTKFKAMAGAKFEFKKIAGDGG
jgi:hypothetical protein